MFDLVTTNNCLLLEHFDGIVLACCLIAAQVDLGRREREGGREKEEGGREGGREGEG